MPADTPVIDPSTGVGFRSSFTVPFWDATRERRLMLQRTPESGAFQFFPMPISQQGSTRDLEWVEVKPVGRLYSFTVTRRGPEAFRGREPYVVVAVTLDAGVRMISNLVDCPLESIRIGMAVEGVWHPLSDGTHLLLFRPSDQDGEHAAEAGDGRETS